MHCGLRGNRSDFLRDVIRDHGWFLWLDPTFLTLVNYVTKLFTVEALLGKGICLFNMNGVGDKSSLPYMYLQAIFILVCREQIETNRKDYYVHLPVWSNALALRLILTSIQHRDVT